MTESARQHAKLDGRLTATRTNTSLKESDPEAWKNPVGSSETQGTCEAGVVASPLPFRRGGLISWPSKKNGKYLVRNRNTGETFQVGEEEQFLLEQLDGRQNAEQLQIAFAARFNRPLSEEDLAEFLELADQRGFLLPAGVEQMDVSPGCEASRFTGRASQPFTQSAPAGSALAGLSERASSLLKLALGQLLTLLATLLQSMDSALQFLRRTIHLLHLRRFAFVPRSDDIFIVTYPRSGTTWMQMILYQLTTDGSMDFPHIAEYCPWFERSQRSTRGFETCPSPRIFKSHLPYQKIPKGAGKYIYVARDGGDVAVSYFHLYRMYQGYEGTFAEFFEQFLRGEVQFGSWFRHVRGWWEHRHDPNVLFLTYEELTRDLEGCIRKISDFCGLDTRADTLPGIVERSSFSFMKKHEAQFDPAIEMLWEQGTRLNSFLRNGRVGDGAIHLSCEQLERLEEAFRNGFAKTEFVSRTAANQTAKGKL
jgi:Sulfotransferase domain